MSFVGLALEIQLQIWETLLYDARVIELSHSMSTSPHFLCRRANSETAQQPKSHSALTIVAVPTVVPVILHICHESRRVGLRYYQLLSLGGYFNFAVDTLLFSPDLFPQMGWHNIPLAPNLPLLSSEIRALKHVGFFFPSRDGFVYDKKHRAKRIQTMAHPFTNLLTITYFWDEFNARSTIDVDTHLDDQLSAFNGLSWDETQQIPKLRFGLLSSYDRPVCCHNHVAGLCEACHSLRFLGYLPQSDGAYYCYHSTIYQFTG